MKKTKIICSIGPASINVDTMSKMVEAGMNVARINFSHATLEELVGVVDSVKKVRETTGKQIAILYDTKGPDFRTGNLEKEAINLIEGKTIRIVKDDVLGNEERITVNYKETIDDIEIGNYILLEDGLMKLKVVSKEEDGITCLIIDGGILGPRKGVNVPGVNLSIPFMSKQDKEDIIYACNHDGDFLALSFVDNKENVLEAREILKSQNRENMQIISKIESHTAIENIDEIIEVSDGIMVARGDLGVEVPMQELPILQKMIIEKCREYGKICIVATEMLASMYTNARPTRAEVSDIANAVLDGTDAVMLSGETTIGKHPVEAVKYMADICENAEKYYNYDYIFNSVRKKDITETIAKSVIDSSNMLDVKVIVVCTMSGYSAKTISNLKPEPLILATCPTEEIARSLSLNWGVYPCLVPIFDSTDEIVTSAKEQAHKFTKLHEKDTIIITGGFTNNSKTRATNFMKIEEI